MAVDTPQGSAEAEQSQWFAEGSGAQGSGAQSSGRRSGFAQGTQVSGQASAPSFGHWLQTEQQANALHEALQDAQLRGH